jgi:hypothetical protein
VGLSARYGKSGDMIGEDGGGGDITKAVVGGVVITGGDDKDGGEDKSNDGSVGTVTLDPTFAEWTAMDRRLLDLSSSKRFRSVCTFSLKHRWDGNAAVRKRILL